MIIVVFGVELVSGLPATIVPRKSQACSTYRSNVGRNLNTHGHFPVGSIASVQRGTSGKHARAGIEELSEETYLDLLKYVTNDSTLIGPLSFKETICTAPEA